MNILGIGDARGAAAALVAHGTLVGTAEEPGGGPGFPWAAVRRLLDLHGLSVGDIGLVGVAGRFSPPLPVRRFPGLLAWTADPFSAAPRVDAALQAVLGGSGWGAFEEDRAAAWFEGHLAEQGLTPYRVQLVDVHRALAAAAYRLQPHDETLVITLHPKGDGHLIGVFRGVGGHVQPLWSQAGFSALHLHLRRCAVALGLDPHDAPAMTAAAGRGRADGTLVDLLGEHLRADGPRLTRVSTRPPPPTHRVYDALRAAGPEVGMASVLANLGDAIGQMVAFHVRKWHARRVVLAGSLVDDPRLVGRIAERVDCEEVRITPAVGWTALAVGTALRLGGQAPADVDGRGLGEVAPPGDAPIDEIVAVLAAGGSVLRYAGRGGWGRYGGGRRVVLARADRPLVVDRLRRSVGFPGDPGCLAELDGRTVAGWGRVRAAARLGLVAVAPSRAFATAHPAVIAPDGLAIPCGPDDADVDLVEVIRRLGAATGCRALAAVPAPVDGSDAAATLWADGDLDGLWLGGTWRAR